MVAAANFVGMAVNFDQYLSDTKHQYYSERTYNIVNILNFHYQIPTSDTHLVVPQIFEAILRMAFT